MAQRTDSEAGDTALSEIKIKIVDCEVADWYPEYWESCNATIAARFKASSQIGLTLCKVLCQSTHMGI